MTPMKKKDLKYSMRTAITLAELAVKMDELVRRMAFDLVDSIELAGVTDKETNSHDFRLDEDVHALLGAYDKFIDKAITLRDDIETVWMEESAK